MINNSNNIKVIKTITTAAAATGATSLKIGHKSPIIINSGMKKISTTPSSIVHSNGNNLPTSNSQQPPVQILLTRKIGSCNETSATTQLLTATNQLNSHNTTSQTTTSQQQQTIQHQQFSQLPQNTIITSTKTGGVIQRHSTLPASSSSSNTSTIIIKTQNDADDETYDTNTPLNQGIPLSQLITTEEIIKKFRIPKGIALTPKFAHDLSSAGGGGGGVNANEIAMESHNLSQLPTTLISPPLTSNDEGDNSSALVEYVEEIYDDEEAEGTVEELEEIQEFQEQEMLEEELEEDPTTTGAVISVVHAQEVQEEEVEDGGEQIMHEIEEHELIEEVESTDHQDLLMSGEPDDFMENPQSTSRILLTSSPVPQSTTISTNNQAPTQIIQAVQPNGTVTCFQLPANTILLQSPQGALLATTAPHPTKPGHQQIVAIQSLSNQLNAVSVQPPPTPATTTVILTADGTAIPLVNNNSQNNSSSGSSNGGANSNVTSSNSLNLAQSSPQTAGSNTSNETTAALLKAQQQQILA